VIEESQFLDIAIRVLSIRLDRSIGRRLRRIDVYFIHRYGWIVRSITVQIIFGVFHGPLTATNFFDFIWDSDTNSSSTIRRINVPHPVAIRWPYIGSSSYTIGSNRACCLWEDPYSPSGQTTTHDSGGG
uniref:Uncharacterized protein n=1 Tax=Anopheles dirus TaxID=7168 RepID=A0A182NSV3_9DIPT